MTKKLTKEEFKCAAALVHSDTYDYSCTNYVNAKTKIEIICHEHGAFWQVASKHLIGQGCKKCGQARSNKHNTKSHEDFVTAALAAHGDKYSYSMSIYNGSHSLINIECRKHGVFSQIAGKHLAGQGCPLCNNEDRSLNMRGDLDKFVADSKEVHGERYKYHLSEFVNDKTPVSIICDKHGVFNQNTISTQEGQRLSRVCCEWVQVRTFRVFYMYSHLVTYSRLVSLTGKEIQEFTRFLQVQSGSLRLLLNWHSKMVEYLRV